MCSELIENDIQIIFDAAFFSGAAFGASFLAIALLFLPQVFYFCKGMLCS